MTSKEPDKTYGGQAVLDGVMIRSRYSAAICVRKPDGTLANKYESVPRIVVPILKNIPFIRGMFVILESLILGFRGLTYSSLVASEAVDEKIDLVKKYPIEHPRCGTAFILYVGIVAFFVLAFTPRDPIWLGIIVRIVTIPIIAGLSYEIIRFSSTFGNTKVGNILSIPTIALQKLTTATPNESQIEVALMAMSKLKEFDEEVSIQRNEKAI